MEISERILDVLQQRGWSKKDLADRMGMTAQNINSTVLNNPKFTVLERVAEALQMPLAELVGSGEQAAPPSPHIVCPKCGEVIPVKTVVDM